MTNDLGSDAGSASMNIVSKVLELLLKLVDKIYEAWRSAPEQKAKIYEVKNARSAEERRKALKKIDSKAGMVNHNLLVKSGEPRTLCGIHLTKEEIKDFNAICKRQGIVFSVVSNEYLKKNNEKAFLGIECRTADLEKIREAVEIFNTEKRQKAIDAKIEEILSKGKENLTEQDYVNLEELSRQKEEAQKNYCDKVNQGRSEEIINNAYDKSQLEPISIEEAINRMTGRSLDKDQFTIVADAQDPDKIIVCHGYNDIDHEGNKYIKTDYEVYHGDELKFKTDDGRFEGRPQDYWEKQRNEIADAADFSGTFYKFINREGYEKWAAFVKEQNAEIGEPHNITDKNYLEIKKNLEAQLDKNGVALIDGTLCNKDSGTPLWYMNLYKQDMKDNILPEDKIRIAESIIIGRQIENCEEIHRIQNELTVAESEVLIASEGTKEHDMAVKNKEELQNRLEQLKNKEQELWSDRKNINAARSEQEIYKEREIGQEKDRGQEEKDAPSHDTRQEEKGTTMDEVKEEIKNEKAKDKGKSIDPAKEVAEKMKSKATKEH